MGRYGDGRAVAEVARAIASCPALNVDETGWCEAKRWAWLWTAVGPGMTLFRIHRSRGADALRRLVGGAITPVITSDRFPTYNKMLLCSFIWAYTRRDFQAMIDRAGGGQDVGSKLLALSGRVFEWWQHLGSGLIRRSTLCRLAAAGGAAGPSSGAERLESVDGQGVPPATSTVTVQLPSAVVAWSARDPRSGSESRCYQRSHSGIGGILGVVNPIGMSLEPPHELSGDKRVIKCHFEWPTVDLDKR